MLLYAIFPMHVSRLKLCQVLKTTSRGPRLETAGFDRPETQMTSENF